LAILSATDRRDVGWLISLRSEAGDEAATLEPLSLQTDRGEVLTGRWTSVEEEGGNMRAEGRLDHPNGTVQFSLHANTPGAQRPTILEWQVEFSGESCTGALLHAVTLDGAPLAPTALDLPSIHYGSNTYGKGMFPQPDPRKGFAFRADRLAQPAIHYSTPCAAWSYFATSEAPDEPEPDLLYSLGMSPAPQKGTSLFFRYPQQEYGHRGDGGPDAYVAKDTYAPGERASKIWQSGETFSKTLFLWCRPPEAEHDYGAVARYLWARAYPHRTARASSSLWRAAGEHVRWFNSRLYNRQLAGGQYESPEGSGTAILGFVEQSLSMAAATLNYALLARAAGGDQAREWEKLAERAAGALTRWAVEGRTEEGLLFPVCTPDGFSFGYRDYSDYENLSINSDGGFDSIRLATEARALLGAAAAIRSSGSTSVAGAEPDAWESAALSVADWLIEHSTPEGGVASRYGRDGEPLDPYPGGTGAAISLICACSHLLESNSDRRAPGYTSHAVAAYENTLATSVRAGRFAGGTLDASTPDREAAIGDLDACLQIFELTGESRYLADARLAADNILSYTMVYPITTFAPGTDAATHRISTFGASIVSPENQHLDPVPTAPGLLLYGLYVGDEVCVQAAVESLRWVLDGRWAIREAEGLKQSEQLLHTRWYYNTFFTQRGDYRRGMPLWGRTDSEHGWPQVVPTQAFLACGQVLLDWHSGRAVAIDGWRVEKAAKAPDGRINLTLTRSAGSGTTGLLLKVVRMPITEGAKLSANGATETVSSAHLAHGYMLNLPDEGGLNLQLSLA
jgi:hypothetical protein